MFEITLMLPDKKLLTSQWVFDGEGTRCMPSLVLNHPHLTSMAKDDFTYWKCLQVLFSVKSGGKKVILTQQNIA